MKAVAHERYGPPAVLQLRDVARPTFGEDDVLVRVHAAGVDAGVWHLTTGLPFLVRLMGLGFRAPRTHVRGIDLAGRVEVVGANVTRLHVGDEVFGACDHRDEGSFAEYARVSASRLAPRPANLSFAQAAAVPVSGCTALQGLRDAGKLRSGQTVLVIGAGGGVGTYAVQIAKALGAEVTGLCSATKIDMVAAIGADHVIDYTTQPFPDDEHRYDLVLDTGGRRALSVLRRALAPHGTLVIVGGEGGNRWTGGFGRQVLRAPLMSLFVSQTLRSLTADVRAGDLDTLRELIEAGKVMPVVDRTYPLAEAAEAVLYQHEGRARGKVVLAVSDQE